MKINAISVPLQDSALEAAKKADKLLMSGETSLPLLGVPMTVKENIDCVGSVTSFTVNVFKAADAL